MTIEQLTRVTSYPWYGAGGHQSLGAPPYVFTVNGHDLVNKDGKWVSTLRALHRYNLRLFVDSWRIVPETTSNNQSFTIKLNPTEQNFFYDDFLKLLQANGRNAIICPSGLFDWLVVPGYSQRKSACYDHSKSPSDPTAWKDFAHLFKLLTEYFKDKPYKVKLQGGNELDFRWQVMHELTPEEIAVGQWEFIKAVFDTNPEQDIMLGCTLNPTMDTYNRITNTIDQLAAAEDRLVPWHKITWSDNHYVRDAGGNQGGGLADTPESQWEQTYVYRTQLNTACKLRGMKWEITEQGYSNSTSTSFAALKQKAPTLQGVSHDVAPGVLWFRSMLMYASFSECVGVSRYHCKNGFEQEPFLFIGINHDDDFDIGKEDWSDKECKIYYEQQLDLFGKHDVVKYHRANGIYYAEFENGKILHWSDKVNVGTATPIPTETTLIPTNMELKVTDKKLNVFLTHFDSPEARLLDGYESAFSQEIKDLAPFGNCITVTLRGDDVAVNPWINNNPANGVDVNKIRKWKGQLLEWITERRKYKDDAAIIGYFGERTNWNSLTDDQNYQLIDTVAAEFKAGIDITGNCIFGWEEIGQNTSSTIVASFVNKMAARIKSQMPKALVMIHNNPGEKHWRTPMNIDMVCLQETSLSAFASSAQDVINNGYAVHLHEYYNPISTGALTDAKKKVIDDYVKTSRGIVSGYGLYIQGYDTVKPSNVNLDTQKYFANAINGVIIPPPNPTTMKIGFSRNANRTDFREFVEGESIAAGNIYIEARDVTPTVYFTLVKNAVTIVNNKPENGAPYDAHGGQPYNATDGSYSLAVTDKTSTKTAYFTVGTVTPPPTGDIAGTSFALKPNGQIEFTFTGGVKKLVNAV